MYEQHSYEQIMRRCLEKIDSPVDKREGSIIYDALAPACAQLAMLYTELEVILERAFPDTAMGEDLERKAAERGLTRKKASCAVCRGEFYTPEGAPCMLEEGARFSGGGLNFTLGQRLQGGVYQLVCETAGEAGNRYLGTLLPVEHHAQLASATLTQVLIAGEDQESDERLRARYFHSFQTQSFGGNIADYREKVGMMEGVGGVKVQRVGTAGASVDVCILSSDWRAPSEVLIASVQGALDPPAAHGAGLGLAPIGHRVCVRGVRERAVMLAMCLTLEKGVELGNVQGQVEAAITAYLRELAQGWDKAAYSVVRLSHLETRILSVTGVVDVGAVRVNGVAGNLRLEEDEIPVLGGIEHETM